MNSLSSLPPVSTFISQSPAVREPRGAGNVSSEAPAEPGNRAVRAADESEAAGTNRKAGEPSASDKEVGGLNEAELKELSELKARDREVRAHEAAHQAVGGQYAGSMSFTYQRGADGAQYAVGGEVSIDVSPVNGDPQATIEKMRVVRAAAMAPAEPSGQDRAVAAQAMQTMLQAQSELASEQGSSDSEGEVSARVDDGVSSDSRDSSSASESSAEQLSRASQQARSTYQDIAGFVPDSTSGKDGFLPISV